MFISKKRRRPRLPEDQRLLARPPALCAVARRPALARDGFAFGPRGALLFDPASPQDEGGGGTRNPHPEEEQQEARRGAAPTGTRQNPLNLTPGRGLRAGGAQPGILSGLAKDAGARFTPNSRERLARKAAFRQGLSQADEAEFEATGKLLDEGMTALRGRRAASNDGLERKGLDIMEEDLSEMETDFAREKTIRETSVPSSSFEMVTASPPQDEEPRSGVSKGEEEDTSATEALLEGVEHARQAGSAEGIQITSADTGIQSDAGPELLAPNPLADQRQKVESALIQGTGAESRTALVGKLEETAPELTRAAREEFLSRDGAAGPQTPSPSGELAKRQASLAAQSPDWLDTQHLELTKQIGKMREEGVDSESDNHQRTLVEHAILDQAATGQRNGAITLYNSGPRERAMRDGLSAEFPIAENQSANSGPAIYEIELQGIETVKRYGMTIGKIAKEVGVDPTLLTAVIYTENARGWYGHLGEALDVSDTILPMNINPKKWSHYFDGDPSKASDPEANIRAGARLIKDLAERIPDASVAKIATLWNSMAKEEVSEFGARVRKIYEEKPWARTDFDPDSP